MKIMLLSDLIIGSQSFSAGTIQDVEGDVARMLARIRKARLATEDEIEADKPKTKTSKKGKEE